MGKRSGGYHTDYDGAWKEALDHYLEVQSQPDRDLPARLYQYHHRIADRYHRRVVSMAVLADHSPGFRPGPYEEETWGCRVRLDFGGN